MLPKNSFIWGKQSKGDGTNASSAVKLPLIMNCEGIFTMMAEIVVRDRSTYIPPKQRDRIENRNTDIGNSWTSNKQLIFQTSNYFGSGDAVMIFSNVSARNPSAGRKHHAWSLSMVKLTKHKTMHIKRFAIKLRWSVFSICKHK